MIRAAVYLWRFLRGYRVCDTCGKQFPQADVYGINGAERILWACRDCNAVYLAGVFPPE